MADGDAGLDQPDGEQREVVAATIAPWRAIVGGDAPRQTVAPEGRDQSRLHGLGGLVGASFQHQREPRIIVEHGQRMQPAGAHMALEVHLPQVVGCSMLETNERFGAAAERTQLDAVAAQDARHCRSGRMAKPLARKHPRDLAPAPRRMRRAHRKRRRFDLRALRRGLERGWRERSTSPASPSAR
ncbi:hypothetical protein NKI52_31355 [Mesorhizobium sp. M0590]